MFKIPILKKTLFDDFSLNTDYKENRLHFLIISAVIIVIFL